MLKLKAALVSLVLGSSSLALAAPVTFTATADASFSFGPNIRDHRVPAPYAMPGRTSWIQLAAPMSLRNGSAIVHPGLSQISQLRLQAGRGMTYVQRVELRFRDGSSQSLRVNKWLTSASSIDLAVRNDRRIVDSITVIGSANRYATHQLFAQGSRVEQPLPPVYQPPVYQPPVYTPPVYTPPVYNAGISLGQDMSFAGTDGRRFLEVGASKGAFNTLRLGGATGSTFIQMVKITFTDGSEQFLGAVQATLLPNQHIDIPLDGYDARSVQQIVVWTDDRGLAIQTSTGTFNAALL